MQTSAPEPFSPREFSRRLFEMERDFHQRLVAENDRGRRKQLYSEFYERLTLFFRRNDPQKTSFGSFSPTLMPLLAPFIRGKVVLDFGCGYGSATFEFGPHASTVIAAEVSRPMIEAMGATMRQKRLSNVVPVLLADDPERALSRWLGAIDVFYSNDVVEHLHPDDMRDHLALAARLLRPGGLYICITPNRITGPHDVSAHFLPYHSKAQGAHISEYSYRELCEAFRAAGFVRFRTPITAAGYNHLRSDAAHRRLLVPPRFKFALESLWFERVKTHRPKLLNLFCLNKVVLFAWTP